MLRRIWATLAVLLLPAVLVGASTTAAAATPDVTITATTASDGTTTLTYRATATAAGTVRHIQVSIPAGSAGRITSINGTVTTVAPNVLRWTPSRTVTVGVGARFALPFYGLRLPSGGPWTLGFNATSTAGTKISYGTGVLDPSGGTVVTPAVQISAANPIPGQTTSLNYSAVVTQAGSLSSVAMQLPTGTSGSITSVNGSLTTASGYATWTPRAPISVRVGSRLSIPIYNATLSRYGGVMSLRMYARSSTGASLMSGAGTIALIAPPAAMPAVAVTDLAPLPLGCPTKWPTTTTENAKPGTAAWIIPSTQVSTSFSAYLTEVSATCGDSVDLKVDSGELVDVVAYRMGYYGGLGAREVWRQDAVPTVEQPAPTIGGTDAQGRPLKMVSAKNWSKTLTVAIDDRFVPGTYLFRITDGTYSTYSPLTVRDDTRTKHDILIQQATTTWAAYNRWGGYSFYRPSGAGSGRLSFDRPYDGNGSGQYLQLEHGLAYWAESKGLDVTYWTDNDLDEFGGQVPMRAANIFLPGHDEYYTPNMRAALSQAVDKKVNVASLGANTVYRRMWFTSDTRREWDIDIFTDGYYSTTWRWLGDAYASQPLLGAEYRCPLPGNTLTTGTGWLYEGITPGTTIPGFIAGEIDRVDTNLYRHPDLKVVGSGTGVCSSGSSSPMHITTFTAPSGARVFNGSTFAYGCFAGGSCTSSWAVPTPSAASQKNVGIMLANITTWVSNGTVTLTQAEKTTVAPMKVKVPQQPLQVFEQP